MAPNKLYSFRYPFDISTTLEPWRGALKNQFDEVVAHLSDRDRALEDHVNLGLSQGRLAYTISTSNQLLVANTNGDITGLTVTVTVPANRVLRVTGQTLFSINAPCTLNGWINEDGTDVAAFGTLSDNGGPGPGTGILQCGSAIRTPSAGVHTYKLRYETIGGGASGIGATATAPGFVLVEDIGPVTS